MRAKRTDSNQQKIVNALRDNHYSVAVTSALGNGFPDLVVGRGMKNWLIEIKDPCQPPSKRKLTYDEFHWHMNWRGQVAVVETAEEALMVCK